MAARAEKHKIGWVVGERRSLGFVMVRSTPWALWASWQDVGYLAPFHGLTCTVVIHEVGTAQLTMACSLSPHDTLRHVVSVIAAGGSIGFFLFSHEVSLETSGTLMRTGSLRSGEVAKSEFKVGEAKRLK